MRKVAGAPVWWRSVQKTAAPQSRIVDNGTEKRENDVTFFKGVINRIYRGDGR
jgi:hypothetical protein